MILQFNKLALPFEPDIPNKLVHFLQLLAKWNRAYNLTAVDTIEEMVTRHLLDAVSALPYIQGLNVIDVGTGAGLPGIPLALFKPEWQFVLLDCQAKKTRFLHQVILELGLKNVRVQHSRVENYIPETKFDTVISRAFAPLASMLVNVSHLCHSKGIIVAMKGRLSDKELEEVPNCFIIHKVYPVLNAIFPTERNIVSIKFKKG